MKIKLLTAVLFLAIFGVLNAQNYKFGKVSKDELLQKEHPTDPTADAAILYRETKSEFQYSQDSGWTLVTDYFERIKIYTKEGFEYANATVDLFKDTSSEDKLRGLKGYTYYLSEDGKVRDVKLQNDGVFEEKTTKYLTQTKITMPDVREGCIIEYKYSISSPFILSIDEFRLQETIPVDKVSVLFKSPEYFIFKNHQRGWIPFKIDTETRERVMVFNQTSQDLSGFGAIGIPKTSSREVRFKENSYIIELNSVPALKEEAFSGNLSNYTTALQFELSYINMPGSSKSYATTWEDVSNTIYNRSEFGSELQRNNYFEKDIDALLSGVTMPEEKIEKIYYYVLNKMNWNGYNGFYTNEGVKNAYKKGSGNVGDINLMLVAMLRYANLDANPVLISTKSHGIPLFPTINGFNYVIASVVLPKGTILLDATQKDAEIGVLKSSVINGDGRLIKKDGFSTWVSLRSHIPAVRSTMLNATLQPDLSVRGRTQNRFTGNFAFQYRSKFKILNTESQIKELEKKLKQTELSNHSFENLDKLGQPVSLEYDFESTHGIENVAGKLYISPMLYLATQENPFKAEKREYPIDFGFPLRDRYIVNIALPEGYKVESIPENVAFSWGENLGSYRYLISQTGNNLQLSVEFAINESLIGANDYDGLKKFFELLIAKENEKIVLSKA
ncbi:DUF3857 domain-containing protein [Aequorivita sp. H23M31]|uniref:DUF3857 domain-containing protein n=1 Tax=Aequorivita ciconiae TaxID=2494375 RepID=A0A410G306_9FLAO|nr:DUF3857 domain-containing protein [Aequorivita sp. H23M31]QAA81621.1 DUF3857 domain-containing protein [Aequorivita sp. H23M31]